MMSEEQLREEVNRLVKDKTVQELETAIYFIKSIIDQKQDERPLSEHLANPVYDDEPLTEEDKIAITEASEDIKAGRVYTLDRVAKELGL